MEEFQDPIFKYREVLFPDYLPDHLPHREREIKTISSLVNQGLKGPAANIFIHGPAGTGKTASVKFIFNRLSNTKALPVHLNCFNASTSMAALYNILITFFREVRPTRRMPSRRGLAYDELMDILLQELDRGDVVPVVCFDEVDHLLPRGSEILYDLSRFGEQSRQVQLVAVSNHSSVFSGLDSRIMSSLRPMEEVPFHPYGRDEMREIIGARVEAAFQEGAVSGEAMDALAEVAADRGGDVRIAREALLQAGEMARRKGEERLEKGHLDEVLSDSRFIKTQKLMKGLSRREKEVLKSIPERGRMYKDFSRAYRHSYPNGLRDRMLRYYLEKFSRLGLIDMERRGLGGGYFLRLRVPARLVRELS